jgi:hypothetical protein
MFILLLFYSGNLPDPDLKTDLAPMAIKYQLLGYLLTMKLRNNIISIAFTVYSIASFKVTEHGFTSGFDDNKAPQIHTRHHESLQTVQTALRSVPILGYTKGELTAPPSPTHNYAAPAAQYCLKQFVPVLHFL